MQRVLVSAPAKVNLALRVGGPRPDGFHPLDTVFEALDIYDDVEAVAADDLTLTMRGLGEDLPVDGTNLAMRAAAALRNRSGGVRKSSNVANAHVPAGAQITITKRIPVAGGMAGGSADGAATLVALNELWGLGLSQHTLEHLAADLGSDVPFALTGAIAHGRGRGEHLQPVPALAVHAWVLITRPDGLPTPAVFREFDRLNPDASEPASTEELRAALAGGTIDDVGALMVNDLEEPAISLKPELGDMLAELRGQGLHAILSGSGSTIAVLTEPAALPGLAAELRERYPHTGVVTAYGPASGAHVREAPGEHGGDAAGSHAGAHGGETH